MSTWNDVEFLQIRAYSEHPEVKRAALFLVEAYFADAARRKHEAFPHVNHKRVYRLYRDANLAVRRRKKAKRPLNERVPLQLAQTVNEVWSMDFVSDSLSNGRRIKCLTVADILTSVLPNAQVIEFEGIGHMGPITHPNVVNEAIVSFLNRVA